MTENPHLDHNYMIDTSYNRVIDKLNQFLKEKGLEEEFDSFQPHEKDLPKRTD